MANSVGDSWEEVDYWPDQRNQKALLKDFSFVDFKEALDFVNKVSKLAEKANHHPGISFGWGYVRIWLTSHDTHSITKRDLKLAESIDQIQE